MGEIGLPELVRPVRGEPDPGGAGTLLRLRCDLSRSLQDPPDRDPGHGDVLAVKVFADRVRAGVVPGSGQLVSQLQDAVADVVRGAGRACPRPRGAGPERGVALFQPSVMQLVDECLGHPIPAGNLPVRQFLDGDGFDQHLVLGHRSRCLETSERALTPRSRCRETPVHDVLKPDTTVTARRKPPIRATACRPDRGFSVLWTTKWERDSSHFSNALIKLGLEHRTDVVATFPLRLPGTASSSKTTSGAVPTAATSASTP